MKEKVLTLKETSALFSCMIMMASEILTSMGPMTDSMLKGPSSLCATSSMASVTTKEKDQGLMEQEDIQRWKDIL